MDPVTQLLVAYTLARAARARMASPEMAVILLAGLAPDLDWLWHLPAPFSPLHADGTATQSLVGAAVLAAAIAGGVWMATRKRQPAPSLPRLLAAAFVAAGANLLLGLSATSGIELYWPFRATRFAWNLANGFDVILLAILVICAVVAALFGLVTEEIGAVHDPRPPRAWPVAALALVLLYFGARTMLHQRAEELLGNAEYKGSTARRWVAYPAGSNPFSWRGVVETDSFLAEMEVPVGPGAEFSPDLAALHYKPEPSPQVQAAAAAPLARAYTALARFPLLTVTGLADGWRAELRELGDSPLRSRQGAWHVVIDLDAESKVLHQELLYAATRAP
jgi:membrane-bound metal-dependent hydrolase YbcI (DUF457 family)